MYKEAHQTSARYERDESEFELTHLEEEFYPGFSAPFVKMSPLQIGMKLEDIIDVKQNNTKIIVGSIERIYLSQDHIQPDGYIDIEGLGSLCVSSLDSYHNTQRLSRLSYAKPDREIKTMNLKGEP